MKLPLVYLLWKNKKRAAPTPLFKNDLWKKLDHEWKLKNPAPLYFWQTHLVRFALVCSLGGIMVCGSIASAYAYTSPEVTEGTILYPLKKKLEAAEAGLQRTPEQKAAFLVKKIERREAEARVLARKDKKIGQVRKEIEGLEIELEHAWRPSVASSSEKTPAVKKIEIHLKKRQERLRRLETKQKFQESTTSSVDGAIFREEKEMNKEIKENTSSLKKEKMEDIEFVREKNREMKIRRVLRSDKK